MIPICVLGATGMVGQKLILMLQDHPIFEITLLAASLGNVGKTYGEACHWVVSANSCPKNVRDLILINPESAEFIAKKCPVVFSALPSEVAYTLEAKIAEAGAAVFTNSSAYRRDPEVPILIGPLNLDPWAITLQSRFFKHSRGMIVANANCAVTGLAVALAPLRRLNIRKVLVTTMQSVSGAGLPGPSWNDIDGNVIPYIPGEEEKMCYELRKIYSRSAWHENEAYLEESEDLRISCQCNRVPVAQGHMLSVALELENPPRDARGDIDLEAIAEVFETYTTGPAKCPSEPEQWIQVDRRSDFPQPKFQCDTQRGMGITIGRIQHCPVLGLRFVCLVNNTSLGAAGGAILNAEVGVKRLRILDIKSQNSGERYRLLFPTPNVLH